MQHVMVDLETLGTNANSVILSLGAVRFNLEDNQVDDAAFYASISIDSNLDLGRKVDESTLIWWLKQSPEAQAVFHEPKQSLEHALDAFAEWWGADEQTKYVWSNGADFDIPMLASAYKALKRGTPWNFWDVRCVRTYKNLPGAADVKVAQGIKHNALSDALTQVQLVQEIYKKLFAPSPKVKS